jgi:anti-sigma regulatory factor (Ser/Thr protein kinase)
METAVGVAAPVPTTGHCRHEAFFYDDLTQFLSGCRRFIDEATEQGEPVLVLVSDAKIGALSDGLADPAGVVFADMAEIGRNPGRIMGTWADFLRDHSTSGTCVHGITEPIWAGRTAAELVECQLHEALVNAAFADVDLRLVCPYDVSALPHDVISEALRTHPLVYGDGPSRKSPLFPGLDVLAVPSRDPLPNPPEWAMEFILSSTDELIGVRRFVACWAGEAGLSRSRTEDVVLASNEIATNTLRYGGAGLVRVWWESGDYVVEFIDGGRIEEAMVGRLPPTADALGGRGIWLAHHLCDLVQVRVWEFGSVVRLHNYV